MYCFHTKNENICTYAPLELARDNNVLASLFQTHPSVFECHFPLRTEIVAIGNLDVNRALLHAQIWQQGANFVEL